MNTLIPRGNHQSLDKSSADALLNELQESIQQLDKSMKTNIRQLNKKLDTVLKRVNSSVAVAEEKAGVEVIEQISAEEPQPKNITPSAPVPQSQPPPRSSFFRSYLPENWCFLSYTEMVCAALRFFEHPTTLEMVRTAVKGLPILASDLKTVFYCGELDSNWQSHIDEVLSNSELVKRKHNLVSLTPYGSECFTSIGINLGTQEGAQLAEKSPYLAVHNPPRRLPEDFVFKTIDDVIKESPSVEQKKPLPQTSSTSRQTTRGASLINRPKRNRRS
ncbi:hypothetical protein P9112_009759 [Eukaryota sp. TZLM1-RC]